MIRPVNSTQRSAPIIRVKLNPEAAPGGQADYLELSQRAGLQCRRQSHRWYRSRPSPAWSPAKLFRSHLRGALRPTGRKESWPGMNSFWGMVWITGRCKIFLLGIVSLTAGGKQDTSPGPNCYPLPTSSTLDSSSAKRSWALKCKRQNPKTARMPMIPTPHQTQRGS